MAKKYTRKEKAKMIIADCFENGYDHIAVKNKVLSERKDNIEYFTLILSIDNIARFLNDIEKSSDDLVYSNNQLQLVSVVGCHETNKLFAIDQALELNKEYIDDPYLE